MRSFVIRLIRLYQKTFSPDHGAFLYGPWQKCRFYPTCSHYSILAIKKYGVAKGIFMGVKRIARCHPLGGAGWDPVP